MLITQKLCQSMTVIFLTVALIVGISSKNALAGGGEAKSGHEYVELQPLVLPIIDGNGISQSISLVVAIEVKNSSDAQKVKNIAPKLQDAYIQDMYGVLNKSINFNKGGAIQVKGLKERLNLVTKNVAGDIAYDVLLQVVQQRPL